jgi:hypothetical protein
MTRVDLKSLLPHPRTPHRATTRSTQDNQVTIENRPRGVKVQPGGFQSASQRGVVRGGYQGGE